MTKIYQADSFTDKPFTGNPAGVCILNEPADESWMQDVAREMNLPETAFLYPEDDGYNLRWFAPDAEVDLCGHATLASSHILWEKGYAQENEILKFFTKSGVLTASMNEGWVELDFPILPVEKTDAPDGLIKALGVEPTFIGRNAFDYVLELSSEKDLRDMKPDFSRLANITTRGVSVTSVSSADEYDFVSRFFAPAIGISEDPVTGSAHCCLGPYWMEKTGKSNFTAYQASARGGVIKVQVKDERVLISGKAVTVIEGDIL